MLFIMFFLSFCLKKDMSFLSFCLKSRICLFCLSVLQIRTCLSVSQNLSIMSLFKVESEGDDFAPGFVHAERIGAHCLVLQAVCMVFVKAVGEAVHKLQFRSHLEERHVEITAEASFQIHVVAFEFDVAVVRAREVDGRCQSQYGVRPVVAHTRCGCDEVKRTGEVDRL